MEYYALTGLTTGQLHKLGLLVMQEIGSLVKVERTGGRTARLGGHGRHADAPQCNPGCRSSAFPLQPADGQRRWDLLRPVIGKVLAPLSPIPSRCSAARELPW